MTWIRRRRLTFARGGAAAALAAVVLMLAPHAGQARAMTRARPVRAVMIVLDVNRSLAGWGFTAERSAALDYLKALPHDVRAGLITFNGSWQLVMAPTTDHRKLAIRLGDTQMSGGISSGLYHAISDAESKLRSLGPGSFTRLLVLSDAESLPKKAFVPTVISDVIGLPHDSDDDTAALSRLAASCGGKYVTLTNVGGLAGAFPPLNSGPSKTPTPTSSAQPARRAASQWHADMTLITGLAVIFISLLLMSLLVIGWVSRLLHDRQLSSLLDQYGPRRAASPPKDDGAVFRAAVGGMTRVLRSSNTERGLAGRLEMAGVSRQPAEWALLGSAAAIVLALLVALLSGSIPLGILTGALIGWLGTRSVLSILVSRRRAAFSDQLPELLQLIAGSLRSGFSLAQALDGVVRENVQPAASEFGRALAEARIGLDLDVAVEAVANRMDSDDLRWTVMALRIHRQVGGNLAEILESTAHTMRERAGMRRHVRSLSAEGRLSAYILVGLPILIGGWLFATDRTYVRPLYTSPIGIAMIALAIGMIIVGAVWMRNVIKVEV